MFKGGKLLSLLFSVLFCVGVKTGSITHSRLSVMDRSTVRHGLHVTMGIFPELSLASTFRELFGNRSLKKKIFGPKMEDSCENRENGIMKTSLFVLDSL